MHRFSQKGEDITDFLSLKDYESLCKSSVNSCLRNSTKPKFHDFKNFFKIMKKMLLIVAVAFAAMSCGNKCCEKKCCEQEAEAAAVEVVAEEPAAEEAEAVEAEAEVVAEEAPAEVAE